MALRLMHSRASCLGCKEEDVKTMEDNVYLSTLTTQEITTIDLIPLGKVESTADADLPSPKVEEDLEVTREDLDSLTTAPSHGEILTEDMTMEMQLMDSETMDLEEMDSEDTLEDQDSLIITLSEEGTLTEEITTNM